MANTGLRFMCRCSPQLLSSSKSRNQTCFRTPTSTALRSISVYSYPQYYKTGYGTGPQARVQAALDENTVEYLRVKELKAKDHPGVFHLSKVSLPEKVVDAIQIILSHENVKEIAKEAEYFRNYIWSRRLPMESEMYRAKVAKIEALVKQKDDVMLPFLSENETVKLEKKREQEVLNRMRRSIYHWEPISYTKKKALTYLLSRSAGEYAALCRIFNEISLRDPNFQPKTLCDYGSGVGTVTWAARSFWESSLIEHLCADVSWEMNDLAELILRGGHKNNDHAIPALFLRQHLPESYKIRYDLVVSAYSLMELPSATDRIATIDKLWNKTDDFLVIVEPGTRAGFRAVLEARDYILGLGSSSKKPRNCHVFSPCPNKAECPRFAFDTIPCNFEVKYRPIYPFRVDGCATDRFCYVVLRRGLPDPDDQQWPRLVQEPMIKPRHVICRVCTKDAEIKEVILTKAKHSQQFRLIAKRSGWGDLLPINIKDHENEDNTTDDSTVDPETFNNS